MLQRFALCSIASLSLLAACSSDSNTPGTTTPPDDGSISGDIRQSVTWEDGTRLSGTIRIVEGVSVEIAPGAKITCNEATQIVLGGTLKVKAQAGAHSSIACDKWTGITVGQNGVLDIDGLDLANPGVGFETTRGAGSCIVKNSSITSAPRPFKVGAGSKLVLDHVVASTPDKLGPFDSSVAEIFGTLEASYLEYEANTNEGLMLKGEEASATVTDSILKGKNGQDLISAYYTGQNPEQGRPRLMKVSYTTFSGAHCGPHLQGVVNAEFDHITSRDSILYGITIFDANTVLIKDSNIGGSVAWLDLKGPNPAQVTIENVFVTPDAKTQIVDTGPPVKDVRATAEIAGAGPR